VVAGVAGGARNLLILCSDEHARGAAGCYGHPIAQTPTLDALAAGGTRFTRAYTPSPICVSARACLAAGTPVFENRCWSSAQPFCGQSESWMRRLRDAGRTVASVGKLHFRSPEDDNGFCEEIIPMHLAGGGVGWPQALLREPPADYPEAAEFARNLGPGESDYTGYDRRITAEARRWIFKHGADKTPWALFVSFVSPHYPLIAPPEFFGKYEGCEIAPPPPASPPSHPVLRRLRAFWNYDDYFADDQARSLARRCYFALCSFLDDNIRQTLSALEESGAAADTVVAYISDHGEMLGARGFWAKSLMFEESVGIPMLLAGPGIPAGAVANTPVSLTDIAATAEAALGLAPRPAAAAWRSRPLWEFIRAPEPGRIAFSEYHDGGSPVGFFMLRRGRRKYVHYAGGHPPQLFDLESDPGEENDLAANPGHEKIIRDLRARLGQIADPEETHRRAMADQKSLLQSYGGARAVAAMKSFNYTPVAAKDPPGK
jgi:choline-sulfatase